MALSVVSKKMNLVVCGSDGAVKASISDLILGQREPSPESSSLCVRREGVVCGRQVTLVEMPALYNTQLSEEEVMQETLRCVSLCDPGVHAFLLVIHDGRLADEDRREIEKIQTIFGSTFNNYSMVLFMTEAGQETVDLDEATKNIIDTCKGRSHALDTSRISEILKYVEQMVVQNGESYYTTDMYCSSQVAKVRKLRNKISNLKKQINQMQESSSSRDELRIVLLGKTGVGKSASGNTILEKNVFRELFSARSVTSVCEKESTEIRGRRISVIDTPGLFDTNIPDVEVRKEIVKCVTMAAPGPHVFLLVLKVGRFTQEEQHAVKMIQDLFGEESRRYTMVLFTRGDDLYQMQMSIEDFIKYSECILQNIILQCAGQYHVFNNRNPEDRSQVTALLEKIDSMVAVNGGSCYTNQMFQQVEKALKEEKERILIERQKEVEREKEELKAKYEVEIKKMKKTMEENRQNLENEWREKEKEFQKREAQVKMEKNEQLRREMDEKLRAQQEAFNKELERKQQTLKEKMHEDLEQEKEKYKRKKEKMLKEAEDKARLQAEKEFCYKLEMEVTKAREQGKKEGYEKGQRDAEIGSASYKSWVGQLAHEGCRYFGPVGGAVGGLIGGIVDNYIIH